MKAKDIERFKKYYFKDDVTGCWIWVGGLVNGGYGAFRLGSKILRAHRVAFELFKHSIPNGKLVMHKCDVRRCINPEHLFLGSHKDNTQDMLAKNRGGAWKNNHKGHNNPNAKLSKEDKELIAEKLLQNNCTQKELAKKYNVGRGALWRLCREYNLKKVYRQGWIKI
jgi:hypothetical protein